MKKIKVLLMLFLLFINIKYVYDDDDIFLSANDNELELIIEDTNVFKNNSERTLEYTYHDNKNNNGLWFSNSKDKDKNYDYVIMHGGCNDINKNVPLGTFNNEDFSGEYDTNTFLGGLEYYLYNVTNNWPHAKMGYIINYRTPNNDGRNNEKSAEYYSKMKEVLKKWNISYLDLFDGKSDSGEYYSDLLKVTTNEYLPDTLHLNKSGYKVIYPYI